MKKRKASIPPHIRRRVLRRDRKTCRYCGSKEGPFHLDHVYPESRGRETTINNLVTACADCNRRKHARVGMWPKPIGYFEPDPEPVHLKSNLASAILLWATLAGAWLYFGPDLWYTKCIFGLAIWFSLTTFIRHMAERNRQHNEEI